MTHYIVTGTIIPCILWATIVTCMERNRSSDKERLLRDLFNGYDPRVGARRQGNASVLVTYRFLLYQIIEVIESKQAVVLNTWAREVWEDEYLYWNPEEYGNISVLSIPYRSIWVPDTVLWNSFSIVMKDEDTRRPLNIKLMMRPHARDRVFVEFMYPALLSPSCPLNVLNFPFDQQTCELLISSWSSDSSGIDYEIADDATQQGQYQEHEGWELVDFNVTARHEKYESSTHPWGLVVYNITIKRKPLLYIVNLIIPTTIISFISILGFFSPTSTNGDRTEKVTLGITTLLAMSILLLTVSDKMPTTSNFIPLIGWFFLSMIILIAFGTAGTTLIVFLHHQGKYGTLPAPCLVNVTALLATILRIPTMRIHRFPTDQEPANHNGNNLPNNNYHAMETGVPLAVQEELDFILANSTTPREDGIELLAMSSPRAAAFIQQRHPSPEREVTSGGDESSEVTKTRKKKKFRTSCFRSETNQHRLSKRRLEHSQEAWDWVSTVIERLFLVVSFAILIAICTSLVVQGYFI